MDKKLVASNALFSSCNRYRHFLFRIWDLSIPAVNFIMLNPSTASQVKDDPTIRRCMDFADRWGAGGIIVTNLFEYRTSEPKRLFWVSSPICAIGNTNPNQFVKDPVRAIQENFNLKVLCDKTIFSWGSHGKFMDRDKEVIAMHPNGFCLGKTIKGTPRHPLYLLKTTPLEPFST